MEPLTRIEDIAHVRFAAPNPSEMRRFLDEFGLITREVDGCLYGVGRDGAAFAYVTELGERAFRALGLRAGCVDDVRQLAERDGVAAERFDAPGGGLVVGLFAPAVRH